jgi:hypothetical protein
MYLDQRAEEKIIVKISKITEFDQEKVAFKEDKTAWDEREDNNERSSIQSEVQYAANL